MPQPASFDNTVEVIENGKLTLVTQPAIWLWGDGWSGRTSEPNWAGDNWYLEADRAPQAWNLRQAAADRQRSDPTPVLSLVLDGPADRLHPDLGGVDLN